MTVSLQQCKDDIMKPMWVTPLNWSWNLKDQYPFKLAERTWVWGLTDPDLHNESLSYLLMREDDIVIICPPQPAMRIRTKNV